MIWFKNCSDVRLPPYQVLKVVHTLTQSEGWGIKQLNVPATWTVTRGEDQTAMVIDTGCTNHPDLQGAIIHDQSKSFVSHETDIYDQNGHSTHCSGIVGARDNTVGMVGVAPDCKIITCKVLDADGTGAYENINAALEYAVQVKPSVVSMSLGGPVGNTKMHNLIKQLYSMNIPVIVAAGNEGPEPNTMGYPALYPETISVGAFDSNGNLASFSSRGSEVDFTAPGVKIYSTWLNNEYAILDGTSMATPFMTGLVCLLLAKHAKQEKETGMNDCKTVEQIREHLIKYADDKGIVGKDDGWGYGIVDPKKLIFEDSTITPTPSSVPTPPKPPKKGLLGFLKKVWEYLFGG